MRDGLSILDQAIAYSGNNISSKKIISMLGTIDDVFLTLILYPLIADSTCNINPIIDAILSWLSILK